VPEFKTITFELVPEESTRLANLKAGSADIVQLSGATLATLDSDTKTVQTPDAWTSSLFIGGLYFDRPEYKEVPYADPNVRKAMAMAIDREAIAKNLYGGAAEPGTGWGIYPFSNELTPPKYDPETAKQMLKDANWPSDYVMTLWVQASPQLGDVQTLTEAIAAMLNDVGIKTKIETIDAATAQQRFQAFTTDGVLTASPGRLWFDPQPAWQVLFHSGSLYESFYSKEMDQMIDELAATNDPAKRIDLEKQIHHYMIDDQMVAIPLITGTSVYGVSGNVGDWPTLRGPTPLYLEYATHATPTGTFRLFEP
jgi:peptide/nickel transport system substrate-binding protein